MQLDLSANKVEGGDSIVENTSIPHIIKYMGSKKPIIDFVTTELARVHQKEVPICDLFAGSCSVSAALRHDFNFLSNDIQQYSAVLAHTYFTNLSQFEAGELMDHIELSASIHAHALKKGQGKLLIDFKTVNDLASFYEIENRQRDLINHQFPDIDFQLFTKNYSGTYWSFEQCVWIDAIRKVAEGYKGSAIFYVIISSLMYAMSYTSQSTGHFAQYRDGKTLKAMSDILMYRQKDIRSLFRRKLTDLIQSLRTETRCIQTTSLDYIDCLKALPPETTVYADPPYASVHYSRFYHALETLIRYDYPELEFKGRYRKDRHQSPFSQKKLAEKAFRDLFEGVISKKSQLVLSYSDTGVLTIESIYQLAERTFPKKFYKLDFKIANHSHSSMGYDKKRTVSEHLILAKRK